MGDAHSGKDGGGRPVMDNPMGIRVVRFPRGRMVTSGPGFFGEEAFERFDRFLTRQPEDLSPRDFLGSDPTGEKLAWNYVIPLGVDERTLDTDGMAVVDFPGGLYAVLISRDGDDRDAARVHAAIREWVVAAGYRVDEGNGRSAMGHMTAPHDTLEFTGYQQMEIFVPIAE